MFPAEPDLHHAGLIYALPLRMECAVYFPPPFPLFYNEDTFPGPSLKLNEREVRIPFAGECKNIRGEPEALPRHPFRLTDSPSFSRRASGYTHRYMWFQVLTRFS
jgi:hypothetical protein